MGKVDNFFTSSSFAVVGATPRQEKFGYKVFKRLQKLGKPVYPIHPKADEIDGEKVFTALSELPEVPEAVNIIVSSKITEKVVEQCKKLGIKKIWMQPGAESATAIQFCEDNNIEVVHNDCVLVHNEY